MNSALKLFLVVSFLSSGVDVSAQTAGNLSEVQRAVIEYPSVSVALNALHKKPGVAFHTENNLLVANEEATSTIWSFAPTGHPAYPTVVKRSIVVEDGVTNIKMDVLCESNKVACDSVVIQFQQINEHVVDSNRKNGP